MEFCNVGDLKQWLRTASVTNTQLREILRKLDARVSGNKVEMLSRLENLLEQRADDEEIELGEIIGDVPGADSISRACQILEGVRDYVPATAKPRAQSVSSRCSRKSQRTAKLGASSEGREGEGADKSRVLESERHSGPAAAAESIGAYVVIVRSSFVIVIMPAIIAHRFYVITSSFSN